MAGVSGVLYRDVGMQYDHAFRRWLIGSVKLGFGVDTYKGGSTSSSTTTVSTICGCVITDAGRDHARPAGPALFGRLRPHLQAQPRASGSRASSEQDWVRSNVSGNDYDESLFLAGIRLQR